MTLPENASAASTLRFEIAGAIAATCPPDLGVEIALTGSTARGIADDSSDIELILWVHEMPSVERMRAWLVAAGATDISPEPLHNDLDGSQWLTCRRGDIWVEAGWGRIEDFGQLIDRVARGEITGLGRLQFADIVLHALPLRTQGALQHWQNALVSYPESLRAAVIADNTAVWSDPHVPGVRWALADRNELYVLAMRLQWDVENLLAVLYAVNRVWQPDAKWTNRLLPELRVRPERLPERLNLIFTLNDPHACVEACFTLILETLQLVPTEYDVSRAQESIASSLESYRSG